MDRMLIGALLTLTLFSGLPITGYHCLSRAYCDSLERWERVGDASLIWKCVARSTEHNLYFAKAISNDPSLVSFCEGHNGYSYGFDVAKNLYTQFSR